MRIGWINGWRLCCMLAVCGAMFGGAPDAAAQGWFGGGDDNKQAEKEYRKAASAYGSADYAKVIRITQEIIKEYPKFAKAYGLRGKAFKDMGDVDKAMADLNKAISLDASQGEPFFTRGQVHEIMGAIDSAKKDYLLACQNGYRMACDF